MSTKAERTERVAARLSAGLRKTFVKFYRPFDGTGSTDGYVLEIGPEFFLLAIVEDCCWFNGFQCIRLQDVRKLEAPARYSAFAEAALRKRGERIPRKPKIDMSSVQELLRTADRAFPLVTIHREIVSEDTCEIGKVREISMKHVALLEIGPDAEWEDKPFQYRLSEITRVNFGGRYEEALSLVGGEPGPSALR